MSKLAAAMIALLTFSTANSAMADPPVPSVSDAEQNVLFAVTQLCAPFVLDRVDMAALPLKAPLVVTEGARDAGGGSTLRVGGAGFVRVSLKQNGAGRACDVTASRAPPAEMRKAFLAAVALRPERFAPTKSKYYPGRFAAEDSLCADSASPRPNAMVLLSTTSGADPNSVAAIFTLADGTTRGLQCDQDGVELNYRTLIKPLSQAEIDAKASASTEKRSRILAALDRHTNRFLHVAPHIPQEIQQNALKNSDKLNMGQDLLAVVDETAFHNGTVGVYFFVDGIVAMPPATGPRFIPYAALRGVTPSKGTFIVTYGKAQVPANLIGKDEMIALLSDVLSVEANSRP
jgi:hypothetical protein